MAAVMWMEPMEMGFLQDYFGSVRFSAKPEQHAMHLIWDCLLCLVCVTAVFFFYAIIHPRARRCVERRAEVESGDREQ
ncbi:hypothetical protein [Thiorhodococcus drewsii]|uniref:hypothetical protein n=1 Tax=Thiorhodococcus drewsii TaxID=210408 RepID=UPI001C1DF44D|nr:hypothetical protein [Thiorhodococcus drewsii]